LLEIYGVLAEQAVQHYHAVVRLRYAFRMYELHTQVSKVLYSDPLFATIHLAPGSLLPLREGFGAAKTYMHRQRRGAPRRWCMPGIESVIEKATGAIGTCSVTDKFITLPDAHQALDAGYPLSVVQAYYPVVTPELREHARQKWSTLVSRTAKAILTLTITPATADLIKLFEGITSQALASNELLACEFGSKGICPALRDYGGQSLLLLAVPAEVPIRLPAALAAVTEFIERSQGSPLVAVVIHVTTRDLPYAQAMFPDRMIQLKAELEAQVLTALVYQASPA
jgi:hypothetical protein